jgi:hypothetical protein
MPLWHKSELIVADNVIGSTGDIYFDVTILIRTDMATLFIIDMKSDYFLLKNWDERWL